MTKLQIMCLQLLYTLKSSLKVTWSNVRKGNLNWAKKAAQRRGLHSHDPQGKGYRRLSICPTKVTHTSSERYNTLPTSHHSTGLKIGFSLQITTKRPQSQYVLPCPPGLNCRPYETCQRRGLWQRLAGWSQSWFLCYDGWLGERCLFHLI